MSKTNSDSLLPPILKNRKKPSSKQTIPSYEFGSTSYEQYNNENSIFLERKNALVNQEAKLTSEEAQQLLKMLADSGYLLATAYGADSPYEKRKVSVASPSVRQPIFLPTKRLPENSAKLRQMIRLFFHHVLTRLHDDANQIYWIVNEIAPMLKKNGIRIKIYTAFQMFQTFDAFLETLESLTFDDEIENFEFFCSALFGFYSQLQ